MERTTSAFVASLRHPDQRLIQIHKLGSPICITLPAQEAILLAKEILQMAENPPQKPAGSA